MIDLAAFIACTATCSVHPRAARTWQKSHGILGESCASHGSPRAGAIGAAFVPARRDTMDRMTREPGKNKRSRRVDTIDAALLAWHAVPCSVESERKRDRRLSSLVSLEPRGEVICPVPSRRVGCDPIPYLARDRYPRPRLLRKYPTLIGHEGFYAATRLKIQKGRRQRATFVSSHDYRYQT